MRGSRENAAPFFFWLDMATVPTSEDLRESAAESADGGVSSVSVDGMSVAAMDPLTQLEVARELERDALPATGKSPASTLGNTVRLISPGAYT